MRDQRILTYAMTNVFATDPAMRGVIVDILARHSQGIRLSDDELAEIRMAGRPRPASTSPGGNIAVLPLWGVVAPHAGVMVDMSTEATSLDDWRQQLAALAADPAVSTIVLRINSPGGSAGGVTETAQAIRDARAKKTVIAVADGMAASAAFCLATQAEEFYVTPSGMVGAVHCYSIHADLSSRLEQAGVKLTLIGEPDAGAAEAPEFLPLSDDNLQHAQRVVSQFYDQFVQDVAKGRGIDASTVEQTYGRGRVLTASDARAAGMVDGVVSFEDVLARLAAGKPVGRGTSQRQQLVEAQAALARTRSISLPAAITAVTKTFPGTQDLSGIHQSSAGPAPVPADALPAASSGSTTGGTMSDTLPIEGKPPTIEELAAQQTHLENEMDNLVAQAPGRALTDDEQTRFDELEAEHIAIGKTIENINTREARRAALTADKSKVISGDGATVARGGIFSNVGRRGPQDIFDLTAYRTHARSVDDLVPLWHDGAKRANEIIAYRTRNLDETRSFVEALLAQDTGTRESESFAHRMLLAGNPAYDAAFGRWVMGRESNTDMGMIRMAVSNTGLGAETPVPVTIDPTVLYTGDGARSPLRQIAQVVSITGLKWRGIASDGVSMSYGAEGVAVNPDTPSFDAPDVTVVKANGEIQFTVEVDDDWPTLRSELQRMFGIARYNLEADKFMNGTGTNEPVGLIFALDDDGSSIVDTETANTIAYADITGLSDELPATFDANASWLAHKKFYSLAEALAVAEGYQNGWVGPGRGFAGPAGSIGALHGNPAYAASEISTAFTTGNEEVAVVGDFAQGFVIVDRVGLNVELDPHPRDTNGKWTGSRALVCWFRNNTALRTPNAFRLLRVKHT